MVEAEMPDHPDAAASAFAPHAAWSDGDRLDAIMIKRRGQVTFRLAMMALMLCFFWRYWTISGMALCAAAYTALQVWEALLLPRMSHRAEAAGLVRVLSVATIAANSVVFGFPAVMWTVNGGLLGLTCSAYLLSGSVLNTVFTTRDCRPAFLASITPFLVYVVIGAVQASGAYLRPEIVATVAIAGAMMAMSAVTLWTDASRTQRSEAAARASLSEREAELELALARAEEASRAKSAFLANMSHELRTPLNGVLGMASVLARTPLEAGQSDMVDVIHGSALNLQTLLSDVLDLAKIEADEMEVEDGVVIPAAIARQVAGLFDGASREKGLRLVLDLDDAAATPVISDGGRLTQILTNLCNNAVKFTEAGEVTLTVRSRPMGSLRRVSFTVRDTGIGLSDDVRPRLFQRFAQADASITRRFGGTGLGLAISRQLCERLGGRMEVESREGVGSAFTAMFDLPAAEAAVETPVDDVSAFDLEGRRPRVLLVEDHPVNRRVVQAMLGELAELAVAADGAEGLEAARTGDYDVILMDIQMPVMDGFAATRAIRVHEREHGRPRTTVIMLTANAMPEHVALSLEAGADDHLSKPITSQALLGKIARSLASAPVETRLAS